MTPLTWQTYIENSLKKYFLRDLLLEKNLMQYLSLLSVEDVGVILLGLYYISEYPSGIIPITKENIQILLDTFLKTIKDNNESIK